MGPGDERAASLQRYYTNIVRAHGGPYDLTLDLGHAAGPEEVSKFDLQVSMSWEHAISLVHVITRLIENYEKQVGALPDIEGVLRREENASTTQEKPS